MSKKISVDQTMNDIVYLQNQIDGLNMLLVQKKEIMAAYFQKSGHKSVSNDECVVYTQERTTVDYDIDKITEKVDPKLTELFIEKEYTISDWKAFGRFCKQNDISASQLRPFIHVMKSINKDRLTKLYEHDKISLKDLEGCYTAKVTKSVALRLKDADRQINLT